MNWDEFKTNPEACCWENDDNNFIHQNRVEPTYLEERSQEIIVDVPQNKNIVFRARVVNNESQEIETKVFFVEVN